MENTQILVILIVVINNHGIVAISSKASTKKSSKKSKKEGCYKTKRDYDVQLCYGAKNYYIGTYQRKVRLP